MNIMQMEVLYFSRDYKCCIMFVTANTGFEKLIQNLYTVIKLTVPSHSMASLSQVSVLSSAYFNCRSYVIINKCINYHFRERKLPMSLDYSIGPTPTRPTDSLIPIWLRFYRAMHFGAKRGIAIACRLSVRLSVYLSVTLVNCDHIGWNSSKIISPLVSLGRSLFATPT